MVRFLIAEHALLLLKVVIAAAVDDVPQDVQEQVRSRNDCLIYLSCMIIWVEPLLILHSCIDVAWLPSLAVPNSSYTLTLWGSGCAGCACAVAGGAVPLPEGAGARRRRGGSSTAARTPPAAFALLTHARLSLVVRVCFRERLHKDVARDRRRRKEGETAFGPPNTPPACLCLRSFGAPICGENGTAGAVRLRA